jgi:hypothetical protein
MRKWWFVILLVAVLALAGCNGGKKSATENATPTATAFVPTPLPPTWTALPPGFIPSPTNNPAPSAAGNPAADGASTQPAGGTPLPPTWTALPPGFIPSPTDSPAPSATTNLAAEGASTQPAGGTPFPPTWTPGKRPSATPRYTATPRSPTLGPAPTWTAQPAYCYTLNVAGTNPQIKPGDSVTINWVPIAGINNYEFTVRHPGGGVIFQQAVTGASIDLPGNLFTVAGAYGWDVHPLDDSGQPICFPVSGEIIVSF